MPLLKRLYARYKSQGLVLISIQCDPNSAEMRKAVKDEGMTWPVAQDGKAVTLTAYAGAMLPTFCLIDRTGILRMNSRAYYMLETTLRHFDRL